MGVFKEYGSVFGVILEGFALCHISINFPFMLLRIPKVIGGHISSGLLHILL